MLTPTYKTGNDWFIRSSLSDSDGKPYTDLATAQEVKLIIIDKDSNDAAIIVPTITQNSASPEWSDGKVTFLVPLATTAAITEYGMAYVDIQVTDSEGNVQTWDREPILIKRGYIT